MNAVLRTSLIAAGLIAGAAQAADMTVFKQPNFAGASATIRDGDTNLAPEGFQDQISSIIVNSGRWEVCTQPNFQGDCMTLVPGRYASLDQRLNHRIESVREVTRYADNKHYEDRSVYRGGDRYAERRDFERGGPAPRYGDSGYSRGPAVVLYDGPDFSGRQVRIQGDTPSLYKRGFDDQASSMVIREGTWQVCTSDGYDGFCHTFQPGEYADLRRLDNRIGSLKRVG